MAYKILSVDDSRTIRMIVRKAFSAYACELFEAENGSEGLALAAREKPDLIVLDITMPVMTGIEMLSKLKEEADLKDIPVIMLTAESGKDNVMRIVKMGVKDYVVKPFKGEQLIERAMHILPLKPCVESSAASQDDKDADIFSAEGDIVVITLPRKISRGKAGQIETITRDKVSRLNEAGVRKFIINALEIADLSVTAIQLIIDIANLLVCAKMVVRLVAADHQIEALKGFKETGALATFSSIDSAKDSF